MISLTIGFILCYLISTIRAAIQTRSVSDKWIYSPDGNLWVIGPGSVRKMDDGTFTAWMTDGQHAGDWLTLQRAQKAVEEIARSYRGPGGYAAHYVKVRLQEVAK